MNTISQGWALYNQQSKRAKDYKELDDGIAMIVLLVGLSSIPFIPQLIKIIAKLWTF